MLFVEIKENTEVCLYLSVSTKDTTAGNKANKSHVVFVTRLFHGPYWELFF